MQDCRREQSQLTQLEEAAHELALALRQMRSGLPSTPPNYTGTPFDEVLLEFNALRAALMAGRSLSTSGPASGPASLLGADMAAPPSQPEPDLLSAPPSGPGTLRIPSAPSQPSAPSISSVPNDVVELGYPSPEDYEQWRPQDSDGTL